MKKRVSKQRLPKCKGLCKTYDKVQAATAVYLSQQEDVVCIRCNVDSAIIDGKKYTTDFVCEMADGTLAVRECLYRRYITKPLHLNALEASRVFWLKRGVKRLGDSSKSESIRRGDMSMNGTAIANQRYTMIADILPVLDDNKALIGTIWQCITVEIRLKSLYNIFVKV